MYFFKYKNFSEFLSLMDLNSNPRFRSSIPCLISKRSSLDTLRRCCDKWLADRILPEPN